MHAFRITFALYGFFSTNFYQEIQKMKKFLHLVTMLVLACMLTLSVFSFAGCATKKDPNKIYVGMECGYAPFNYTQTTNVNGAVKISNANGYANGYDVMIAKKIAESLGKELVIVKYKFEALIPAVQAGSLDFIIAGMSPTAERLEAVDFSDAYYESQLVIVVRKDGNFAQATSLNDFNGAKIVAQKGTFHDTAYDHIAACPDDEIGGNIAIYLHAALKINISGRQIHIFHFVNIRYKHLSLYQGNMSVYQGSESSPVFGNLYIMTELQMGFFHLSGPDLGTLYGSSVLSLVLRNDLCQQLSLFTGVDHVQMEIIHRSVIF